MDAQTRKDKLVFMHKTGVFFDAADRSQNFFITKLGDFNRNMEKIIPLSIEHGQFHELITHIKNRPSLIRTLRRWMLKNQAKIQTALLPDLLRVFLLNGSRTKPDYTSPDGVPSEKLALREAKFVLHTCNNLRQPQLADETGQEKALFKMTLGEVLANVLSKIEPRMLISLKPSQLLLETALRQAHKNSKEAVGDLFLRFPATKTDEILSTSSPEVFSMMLEHRPGMLQAMHAPSWLSEKFKAGYEVPYLITIFQNLNFSLNLLPAKQQEDILRAVKEFGVEKVVDSHMSRNHTFVRMHGVLWLQQHFPQKNQKLLEAMAAGVLRLKDDAAEYLTASQRADLPAHLDRRVMENVDHLITTMEAESYPAETWAEAQQEIVSQAKLNFGEESVLAAKIEQAFLGKRLQARSRQKIRTL